MERVTAGRDAASSHNGTTTWGPSCSPGGPFMWEEPHHLFRISQPLPRLRDLAAMRTAWPSQATEEQRRVATSVLPQLTQQNLLVQRASRAMPASSMRTKSSGRRRKAPATEPRWRNMRGVSTASGTAYRICVRFQQFSTDGAPRWGPSIQRAAWDVQCE